MLERGGHGEEIEYRLQHLLHIARVNDIEAMHMRFKIPASHREGDHTNEHGCTG